MRQFFHFICIRVHRNTDNIKSRNQLYLMKLDIRIRCCSHPSPLQFIYKLLWSFTSKRTCTCLYFHKNNLLLAHSYHIHLQMPELPIGIHHPKTLFAHRFASDLLTLLPYDIMLCHLYPCILFTRAASSLSIIASNIVKPHNDEPP